MPVTTLYREHQAQGLPRGDLPTRGRDCVWAPREQILEQA